jgi:phosphoglycerate dehydrogenase-like enzyme
MRIHIQNPDNDPLFDFSMEQWNAAVARAGAIGQGHVVSIGTTAADCAAALAEAEALIADVAAIKAQLPLKAPRLRIVQATVAGIDGLMPLDWLPQGTQLWTNRGIHGAKAGEFGIMAILMLASRVPEFVTDQRAGRWRKLHGSVLAGRRVTIVGLGALGGGVARHARYFGMHVTGVRTSHAPHPDCDAVITEAELDGVLPHTEFLVLATPHTPATRNLLSRRRMELLPRGAGVVNIGRGVLLDQDALCDMLDSGRLGGAVLDVFTPEPVPAGHRLWSTPNLIMSPHTCADDPRTYNPLTLDVFFANLRARAAGEAPPTAVDPARGY